MSRWRNFNQWLFELDTFYRLEGLHLYVWILLNAVYELRSSVRVCGA
ncbi:MAG: hypothetical protein ACQEU4_18610 [Bacillota bacterium]